MGHFSAQLRFPLAAASRQPLAAEIADFPGESELGQLRQGSRENRLVAGALARRPEGSADRVIDERRARRRDLAHDVVRGADN